MYNSVLSMLILNKNLLYQKSVRSNKTYAGSNCRAICDYNIPKLQLETTSDDLLTVESIISPTSKAFLYEKGVFGYRPAKVLKLHRYRNIGRVYPGNGDRRTFSVYLPQSEYGHSQPVTRYRSNASIFQSSIFEEETQYDPPPP